MLIRPGQIGRAGVVRIGSSAAAIAYLLRATFTGGDQAIADTETIGPTGGGATYEGYTESGTGTAVETSTGSVSISSNQLAMTGDGSSLTTTGMIWSGVARTLGRAFKVAFVPAAATDIGAVTLHSTASLATGNLVLKVGWGSDGTFTVSSYSPAGTLAKAYNTGTYTAAGGTIEIVLGGWDSAGAPDATADYGASVFFDNGTTRVLLAVVPELNTATVYLGLAQQTATEVLFDVLTVPDALTAEAVFTPTGYVLDTFADTNGTDLTAHTSDTGESWSLTRQASGTVDVTIQSNRASLPAVNGDYAGYRADTGLADCLILYSWIVNRKTSGGFGGSSCNAFIRTTDANNGWQCGIAAVSVNPMTTFIQERNAGVATSRASGTVSLSNGATAHMAVRANAAEIKMWINGANPLSYASATHNQTETEHGFEIGYSAPSATVTSADNFYVLPLTSADYDTALDAF